MDGKKKGTPIRKHEKVEVKRSRSSQKTTSKRAGSQKSALNGVKGVNNIPELYSLVAHHRRLKINR